MQSLVSTLGLIWRLATPYFRSEDRRMASVLLVAVVAIELSLVGINVLLNWWNARFYNALQDRNWGAFVYELGYFCVLAAIFIVLAVYQTYLQQWLTMRWRAWMTRAYLGHWLMDANHYRMQLLGDAADNPDQRIAEDIRMFIDRCLYIGLRLLSAIVTLASFIVILWTLSDTTPFHVFGYDLVIPGNLVWAALFYAVVGTVLVHLIGSPLIALNFYQQRYEADFRFNLVRARENSEQIALLKGEAAETHRLLDRFGNVMLNWWAIMARTKQLTMFTAGYRQIASVFPYVIMAPAYFSGRVQLGGLMQTASAFDNVRESLSVFVEVYRDLAEWRAVIARLDGFDTAIDQARAAATSPPVIALAEQADADGINARQLEVRLSQGAPLVAVGDLSIAAGDRVLVNGPSGAGKTTLFRAIAGIWPFGQGSITLPAGAKVMMLPQRPYLPIGTLRAAVTYPAEPGSFDIATVADVLAAVGLPGLVDRLEENAHWGRMLSPGEQERLAVARAILHRPDYLFLDEATASLDEAAEADIYRLLLAKLPTAAIVSIGHRSTLGVWHRRKISLDREGSHYRVTEADATG